MNLVARALIHHKAVTESNRIAMDQRRNADLNLLRSRLNDILGGQIIGELGPLEDCYNGHNERKFEKDFYRTFDESHVANAIQYHTLRSAGKFQTHDTRTAILKFTLVPGDSVCCQIFEAYNNPAGNKRLKAGYAKEEFCFSVAEQFLLSLGQYLRDEGAIKITDDSDMDSEADYAALN
jgi:hypothetical protein